ncbi:MAG: hypothetical protein ACRC0J_12095 [Shewanella oncorhynchi]
MLIAKFAIASEGCIPAPAKASSPSMARLTQFVYSPCGNFEGMRIPSIFELSDSHLKH